MVEAPDQVRGRQEKMKDKRALTSGLMASLIALVSNGALAHEQGLRAITGLPEAAIYSIMQRGQNTPEEQYELHYYANRASRAAVAAAPRRICSYVGGHVAVVEEQPTSEILQKNLPDVRLLVVRCD